MATLNFSAGTPTGNTKLIGFDSAVPGGERTYLAGQLPVSGAQAAAIEAVQDNVDAHAALTDAHGATASNTASRIAMRDADGVIGVGGIRFSTTGAPSVPQAGDAWWNDVDKTLNLMSVDGTILQIGHENVLYARNVSGVAEPNGAAIRITGSSGQRTTLGLAQADSFANCNSMIGLVTSEDGIDNNAFGVAAVFGLVRGLDTSAIAEGTEIYLSPTVAGGWTATRPTTEGNFVVRIGWIIRQHATQGMIFLSPHYHGSVTGDAVMNATSKSAARTAIEALGTSDIATSSQVAQATSGKVADALLLAQLDQSRSLNLPKFRSAVAKIRAGVTSDLKILCLGDSNTAGYGAYGAGYSKEGAWPAALSRLLNQAGFNAREDSYVGSNTDSTDPADYDAYDPRVVFEAGVTNPTGIPTLGGWFFLLNGPGLINTHTPDGHFDSVEIYYTATGPITVAVNGVTVGTTTSTTALAKQTFTFARTTGAITLTSSAGDTYVLGARAWDSTAGQVSVIQAGKGATRSSDIANAAAFGPLVAIEMIAPDLTFLSIGINDAINSIPVANYKANVEAIVDRAQLSGDVILVGFVPFNSGSYTTFGLPYLQAMREVAAAKGCLFLDTSIRFVSYAEVLARGYSFDNLHPSAAGYDEYANMVGSELLRFSKTAGTEKIARTINGVSFDGTANVTVPSVKRTGYTVATLPAGTVGDVAYVTDATAPTYLGTLTGGGAVVTPVFYNGTAWVSH